jgi:hypothetical protein
MIFALSLTSCRTSHNSPRELATRTVISLPEDIQFIWLLVLKFATDALAVCRASKGTPAVVISTCSGMN